MLTKSSESRVKGNNGRSIIYSISDPFGEVISRAGLLATEFSYGKRTEIYGEGEPAEYVYQILSGIARSYKLLADGRRQIGAFHVPGDVFGLEAGPSYRVTVEAIASTKVRLVKRHSLLQAAALAPEVACSLWTFTANELRHVEDHLLLLGRKNAMERVASFLLEMDRRLPVATMIALPITRRDISDYLGLTLETVSRVLSHLNAKGIIKLSGDCNREIVVCSRKRLGDVDGFNLGKYQGCNGIREPVVS